MESNEPAASKITIRVGDTDIVLSVKDDFAIVPASLKLPNGAPRFYLSFPKALGQVDQGAKYLVFHEAKGGGYEPPTRNLLERILRAGDLFIDVGAHWGFFTLQAATHPATNIAVIAFEPDPTNAGILLRNVADHGLRQTVSVVCAACGDSFDLAPLVTNSSMMHSIHGVGLKGGFTKGPAHWVSVITLDAALTRFPLFAGRQVILKIDAEGFEPKVIRGARALLQSGRVALIIWEFGQAFTAGAEREAMLDVLSGLTKLGFQHVRTDSQHTDGPVIPFSATEPYIGNVFSYRPQLLTDFR